MNESHPTSCETCTRTFCTDGPCKIRDRRNKTMAEAFRLLAQVCREERESHHSEDMSEQCWDCPIASVCSKYMVEADKFGMRTKEITLEEMANEAMLAIEPKSEKS